MNTTISMGLLVAAMAGCGGERAAVGLALDGGFASDAAEADARTGPLDATGDGGARPGDAGPAQIHLRIEQAWYAEAHALRLALRLEHRSGGPAAIDPSRFSVWMADGAQVRGVDSGSSACEGSLERGRARRCVVGFETSATPEQLTYGGATPVAIEPCASDSPFGLCEAERACVDGACERTCSRFHWDGPCVNPDEVCDRGVCVAPCSDLAGSGCEEGTCVQGVCVPECGAIALSNHLCSTCAWDLFDAEVCTVESACEDCAHCPSGQAPGRQAPGRCECLERAQCDGCEAPATQYWDCILEACPSCRE